MASGTTYYMDNDYTLSVHAEDFNNNHHSRSLTRIFNFKSAQVTTLSREYISLGTGVTSNSQMDIRNFADIQSKLEIREMHAKLRELGGHPPDIDDLLNDNTKPLRLPGPARG